MTMRAETTAKGEQDVKGGGEVVKKSDRCGPGLRASPAAATGFWNAVERSNHPRAARNPTCGDLRR
ncbi:hypothetical protein E2C01_024732 [Portunus trituberculatus]|uniref:Uncharacterized protein n=1 Tax=Portunus trituberculatus TaxID=210409 RepID=A0A5B7EEI9_PORTR|nr:hypothetical protein [Portunus trituberculatus]